MEGIAAQTASAPATAAMPGQKDAVPESADKDAEMPHIARSPSLEGIIPKRSRSPPKITQPPTLKQFARSPEEALAYTMTADKIAKTEFTAVNDRQRKVWFIFNPELEVNYLE